MRLTYKAAHKAEETKEKMKPRRNEKGTNNKTWELERKIVGTPTGSASVRLNTILHRVPSAELFLPA